MMARMMADPHYSMRVGSYDTSHRDYDIQIDAPTKEHPTIFYLRLWEFTWACSLVQLRELHAKLTAFLNALPETPTSTGGQA